MNKYTIEKVKKILEHLSDEELDAYIKFLDGLIAKQNAKGAKV